MQIKLSQLHLWHNVDFHKEKKSFVLQNQGYGEALTMEVNGTNFQSM